MVLARDRLNIALKDARENRSSMLAMRDKTVHKLYTHMERRQTLLGQLARDELSDGSRQRYEEILEQRKQLMFSEESELVTLERFLGSHYSILTYADAARMELEEKINTYQTAANRGVSPELSMTGTQSQVNSFLELY